MEGTDSAESEKDLQRRIIDMIKSKKFGDVASMAQPHTLEFYIVSAYLQGNQREVDEWLPLLKECSSIRSEMPKWVICSAFEKGFI